MEVPVYDNNGKIVSYRQEVDENAVTQATTAPQTAGTPEDESGLVPIRSQKIGIDISKDGKKIDRKKSSEQFHCKVYEKSLTCSVIAIYQNLLFVLENIIVHNTFANLI